MVENITTSKEAKLLPKEIQVSGSLLVILKPKTSGSLNKLRLHYRSETKKARGVKVEQITHTFPEIETSGAYIYSSGLISSIFNESILNFLQTVDAKDN